jgi:dynactin 1
MRITIEDLESLKELNDELEENHIETERTLQEEITQKELDVYTQQRKVAQLEETCQDLEGTITQFRELVMQLQMSVFPSIAFHDLRLNSNLTLQGP